LIPDSLQKPKNGGGNLTEKVRVVCLSCGAVNNFPLADKGKKVVCGRCKIPLPIPGVTAEPDRIEILTVLQNSGIPVLADFYSSTCAPCHVMNPVIEDLAARRAGELFVIKVNVDQLPELAAQFGIQGVPTFIIFSKGHERARMSGAMSEADFSLWVASVA
jgi:thioredoxin 2